MANDLSAFEQEIWSPRIISNLDQVNVMVPLVNTDWEGDLRQSKTVKVRTLGSVTMRTYAKNTDITYEDLDPDVQDFTVSDSSYFAFKVDDVDKAQNDINALDRYARRAAVSMSNAVEAKILSRYNLAHADNKIDDGAGGPITLDSSDTATGVYVVISRLAEALSLQSVPEDGRWLLVDPKIRTLLWNDTKHFIRASALGDMILKSGRFDAQGNGTPANRAPGFIGQFLNFDVYMINHLPSTTAGSPAVTSRYMVAGDRDAITYAAQITEMEALRLQNSFGNAVRGLLLHDSTVFDENAKRLATAKVK